MKIKKAWTEFSEPSRLSTSRNNNPRKESLPNNPRRRESLSRNQPLNEKKHPTLNEKEYPTNGEI